MVTYGNFGYHITVSYMFTTVTYDNNSNIYMVTTVMYGNYDNLW